jgi:hypothetical protein
VAEFEGEVVRINPRRKLKLLHLVPGLAAVRILSSLGFLILEFAVVHNPTHGRQGFGGDFDQVAAPALSQAEGIRQGHHPELLFGFVQDADFASADFSVSSMLGLAGPKGAKRAVHRRRFFTVMPEPPPNRRSRH